MFARCVCSGIGLFAEPGKFLRSGVSPLSDDGLWQFYGPLDLAAMMHVARGFSVLTVMVFPDPIVLFCTIAHFFVLPIVFSRPLVYFRISFSVL